ncbi:hypothetical protein CYLTODRAFT_396251, partial [Cylindrobasidium torrendii FP15055 ss-10]
MSLPESELPGIPPAKNLELSDDDDDDDDSDSDIDEEAEKMAQRLRAELLADISRVNAAAVTPQPPPKGPLPSPQQSNTSSVQALSKKEEAILGSMRTILTLLDRDVPARSHMQATPIPSLGNVSVHTILTSLVSSTRVPPEMAKTLHESIIALTRNNDLFDLGKRKRDAQAVPPSQDIIQEPVKRGTYAQHYDLNAQLVEAVGMVSHTLAATASSPLEPTSIHPIQLHLHQIFLFAVTSAPRAGTGTNTLQEIAGLIQVIGVLTGIQIGQNPPAVSSQNPPFNGIVTAVYPCLASGCQKTFSRLFNLRAHQRVHAVDRPYRCPTCPASFVRNHDLKRHVQLHDNKAWKCSGCDKMFSRRDAIKRHKKLSEAHRSKGEACVHGDIIEVENGDDDEGIREEKRVKMWNGISQNVANGGANEVEEGEIQPVMLAQLQTTVLTLHPVLQNRVTNALGNAAAGAPPMNTGQTQSALASVIARVQVQTEMPPAPSEQEPAPAPPPAVPEALSMYGLSDAQTKMLEDAISGAARAAQAQAEAEAALEEEEDESDDEMDMEPVPIPSPAPAEMTAIGNNG